MKTHTLTAGTIWEGDWMLAPLEPGYTLAILDGPMILATVLWSC